MDRDKTLLVLGASSDMGMCLIKNNADDYVRIFAQYRTMSEQLDDIKRSIGDRLVLLQCDLESEAETEELVSVLKAASPHPDHFVHFPAQHLQNRRFHEIPWEVFTKEIDISLRSLVCVSQALLPEMKRRRYGRIVIMLSCVVNGTAKPNVSNYVTVKYAMLGLMRAMAVEYARYGITVNAVSPDYTNTKYISSLPDIMIRDRAENSPIGRNLECSDIIPSINHLLSDDAGCINGHNIVISCGMI